MSVAKHNVLDLGSLQEASLFQSLNTKKTGLVLFETLGVRELLQNVYEHSINHLNMISTNCSPAAGSTQTTFHLFKNPTRVFVAPEVMVFKPHRSINFIKMQHNRCSVNWYAMYCVGVIGVVVVLKMVLILYPSHLYQ